MLYRTFAHAPLRQRSVWNNVVNHHSLTPGQNTAHVHVHVSLTSDMVHILLSLSGDLLQLMSEVSDLHREGSHPLLLLRDEWSDGGWVFHLLQLTGVRLEGRGEGGSSLLA